MTATDQAKYVYGVVPAAAGARVRATGIGERRLAVVAEDGVAALTSDVPAGELEAGRDELLAHARALETVFVETVVLPMRFGVVMEDERAVREQLLGPHREELEAQLAEMDGKAEISIRGIYDEAAILREIVAEDPEAAALRELIAGGDEIATYPERIRLGEVISAGLDAKRGADGAAIAARLARAAVAVDPGDPVHERMAVNASFLVERSRIEEFDREVDALAAEQAGRIAFRYTGPLPPHSFVELSLEA